MLMTPENRAEDLPAIHEAAFDEGGQLSAHLHRQTLLIQGGQGLSRRQLGRLHHALQALLAALFQFHIQDVMQKPFEGPALLLGPSGRFRVA